MKTKLTVFLGLLCLSFFTILMYCHYANIRFSNFVVGILELTTIPMMLFSVVLFFYAGKSWHSEKYKIKSGNLLATIILAATVVLIITGTVFDINR